MYEKILSEDVPHNKWRYSLAQWGCIALWGNVLYIDYPHLPSGPGNLSFVTNAFKELANDTKSGNQDEVSDFNEWAQEGMKVKGNNSPNLTRELYDKIMSSAQRETTELLFLQRKGQIFDNGWTSTSMVDNTTEDAIQIPLGTKVIFADGIADNNEVIIDSSILKELK